MNSATTYKISTSGSAETIRIGKMIGAQLKGGNVIELKGDVGSGKTTLTKGILAGLGFAGEVVSPTFTLSRTYPLETGLIIHHFDFYRLNGQDVATNELHEALDDPMAVVIIEWPGHGEALLPARRLRISILPAPEANHRMILLESIGGDGHSVIKQVSHDNLH